MAISVLVNGAKGRMGQEVVRAVQAEADLHLVGEIDLGDPLDESIRRTGRGGGGLHPPLGGGQEHRDILRCGARPVVGTTGFEPGEIAA